MSVIVTRTDCPPPAKAVSGTASQTFGPNHRWKVLGIGVAANAGFSATFSGVPATAVVMRQGYQLDDASLGLALGLLGLGVALSELPWGVVTDRWGDRRVLLTGLGATAAWLFVMAMLVVPTKGAIPGVTLLSASLLVAGLLGGSVNGSSGRAIMGWFREGERGFAMSIRQTAVPLGGGIGALVLPSLALGFGFAAVFGLLAAVSALSAVFAWRWLHEPPAEGGGHVAATAGPAPLHNLEVWRISSAIGLLCFPQVAVLTFASVFLHDFVGLGTLATSASLAAVQTGAMVMRVWSGRYTDRHGNRRPFLRLCSALSALAFAVLWLLVLTAAGRPALMAALPVVLVVAGIAVSTWHGVAYTELATLAGPGHVGTALSLANSFVFVGFCLVPIAIPGLLHLWAWPGVWLAAAGCALIAWPIFLRPA
ncbi:MFS transporter [Mesorhizobium sp. M4B.F.Ca.ET.215.01.1.1]|uniref:MFS transporter n=2 Tax=Mesorhizobium TaxID=68287 RepID=A0ABU5APA0_9HYPH|nr:MULTISPECIES: MFS transporter [Mesorhizobium]MDX8539122.1 MFS transporter [Mesorhizobium abyssinicae]RUW26391.1 MFS transporter [Mesorhizobium sp. M4B.F.Ca.ET.013.02.1.1]RVD39374.1 MFS transporter [Mesorhizobium sp. M4B.F.Ca.ET.019.03.1.1]TGQ18781.1 MFS transporter [Mesorhizobium sp. M4B.F.Ca.ET.215.01.1.1]TGQ40441.1 MFS transporter [Mesorhizobium sp. M4B.F.Ca.ET.214.01.1.1]